MAAPPGRTVAGATASAYTLTAADEGDNVRMLVTATNPDGVVVAASAPSPAVQAAPPRNTGRAEDRRHPAAGRRRSVAHPGTWSPADVTYIYAWQRGDPVNGFRPIAGATGADLHVERDPTSARRCASS